MLEYHYQSYKKQLRDTFFSLFRGGPSRDAQGGLGSVQYFRNSVWVQTFKWWSRRDDNNFLNTLVFFLSFSSVCFSRYLAIPHFLLVTSCSRDTCWPIRTQEREVKSNRFPQKGNDVFSLSQTVSSVLLVSLRSNDFNKVREHVGHFNKSTVVSEIVTSWRFISC